MTLDVSDISSLGFGVSGPHRCDAIERRKSIRLVREAIDLGVSVFDTAPKYGDGEAESRLGEALRGADRDRLFIVTKAGIIDETNRRDFSPEGIRTSLEGSLKRLGLSYVDALLLQGASSGEHTAELHECLVGLKDAGLVRYIGASGRGQELDQPIGEEAFDIIMAPNYAGLPIEQSTRLERARSAGKRIFAIEAKNGARAGLRLPFSKTDRWYVQRQIKRWLDRNSGKPAPAPGKLPIIEAFDYALNSPLTDCLMVQTTNSDHLLQLTHLAALDGQPGTA